MGIYLKDNDLYYNIKISKGKGYLTPKAQHMLIQIVSGMMQKKVRYYRNEDDYNDVFQSTVLHILSSWKSFNPNKYDRAFAYFSEIAKRGMAASFKEVLGLKPNYDISEFKLFSLDAYHERKNIKD